MRRKVYSFTLCYVIQLQSNHVTKDEEFILNYLSEISRSEKSTRVIAYVLFNISLYIYIYIIGL